ncbi:MAG: response regulator [bacterium]
MTSRRTSATSPLPQLVVVADDDRTLRELIAYGLQKRGYETLLAADGQQAIEMIERSWQEDRPVALLITDLQMPRHGGMELLVALATATRRVLVIVISSFITAESRAEAERLGAAAVFSKPFDLQKLLAEVEECLRG